MGDAWWWGDVAGVNNALLDRAEWGGLNDGSGAAGEGDGVDAAELDQASAAR